MPTGIRPSRPASTSVARRRMVLVVDESRAQRAMLRIHLTRAGYEVNEATNGDDALAFCTSRRPDVVLSDWVMAGMTGPELCQKLRNGATDGYVYFILLSSKDQPADIAFGLESGADDFLTKPTSAAELLARLRAGERILLLQDESRKVNARLTETLEALRKAQVAMDRDLNEARRLQQGLIGERHTQFGDFSVSNLLRPAGHVGGDLTGSFAINAQRFGVFAIDVSGHGVAAALMTARLATQLSASLDQNAALFIDEYGLYDSRPPAVLARYLNHQMLSDLRVDTYFTMVYAVIDQQSGEVRLVQAGHPHPMVQRASGEVELVGNGGFPIGVIENARYEEITLTLNPGDKLVIASDGIWDATNPSGQMLGTDGLSAIMQTNRMSEGLGLMEAMVWSVLRFSGGQQEDDISALLIERKAAP
ncbi:fused response regulator/phosphatase [Paracoccus aurantiacus]|uniref:Fused response regulator/phosphatase n=2 Tax=Paracoccus aurantiacus TaxID=2599412 RepID=A0A5C6RWW2_9RHOB|nr:fused response regulator/phosphatase [Paracoccus aurantiacus]